jgi:hypothetical protein
MEEYDIFFSYSHGDINFALKVYTRLTEAGLKCFLAEKDIPGATPWANKLRDGLISSRKVLLLITDRSLDSQWVIAEAGAAWALQKDILPGLFFVEPEKLFALLTQYQTRRLESPHDIEALVSELSNGESVKNGIISGQWKDYQDRDIAFFKQNGNNVIGYYDLSSGVKAGMYKGTMNNRMFEYRWTLLAGGTGFGRMTLSPDGNHLSGDFWRVKEFPEDITHVGYQKLSEDMPAWLSSNDFEEL